MDQRAQPRRASAERACGAGFCARRAFARGCARCAAVFFAKLEHAVARHPVTATICRVDRPRASAITARRRDRASGQTSAAMRALLVGPELVLPVLSGVLIAAALGLAIYAWLRPSDRDRAER